MAVVKQKLKNNKINLFRARYLQKDHSEKLIFDCIADISDDYIIDLHSKSVIDFEKSTYSQLMVTISKKQVYSEDVNDFLRFFNRENLISSFNTSNENEVSLASEFRFMTINGDIKWISAVIQLFKLNDGITAYILLKDIDNFKNWQTELLFKAEHDALTEMRNKISAEASINSFLAMHGSKGMHAFFFFDIDDFKNINDSYGHIFGDVFLERVAKQTKELFRNDDILGRIGGDEFIVFMKNITDKRSALRKADEMVKCIGKSFDLPEGGLLNATVSIGIAFYENDGKNYQELLRESDTAMYFCKNNGKNKYAVYSAEMDDVTLYRRDSEADLQLFKYDVSEYLFRTLLNNKDQENAFNLALELVCRYYNIDAASVYEANEKKFSFTFAQKGKKNNNTKLLSKFKLSQNYLDSFLDGVFFYTKEYATYKPDVVAYFDNADCVSAVHYAFREKDVLTAMICFSRFSSSANFTTRDIVILRNIANLIYVFLKLFRS